MTKARTGFDFIVVGAGYTGTEVLAHGQKLVSSIVKSRPRLRGVTPKWYLLDTANRVLPGLSDRLSRTTDRVLQRRGVDVRMGCSVKEATADGAYLSDGSFIASRNVTGLFVPIWPPAATFSRS